MLDEDVTLETAGKRVAYTARQILDRLECTKGRRTKKGGQASREEILEGGSETVECVIVEGRGFESKKRAREEIKRIAKLLGYELKQLPKKKTPGHG
jgi:hypothetical protein